MRCLTARLRGSALIFSAAALSACGDGSAASLVLEPCVIADAELAAECGTYTVFENRETRRGRTIALRVVRIPAASLDPAPDPVFLLVGGPGQSAVSTGGDLRELRDTQRDRAIVLVDQRGTGQSNRLNCVLYGDTLDLRAYLGDQFAAAEVRRCREELAQRADLSWYATPAAVADLDEVRTALGYERINLEGGSYGTRVALEYLRRHPDHVRSAVLLSVAPTNFGLPLPFARAAQDAMDSLFVDCAEDTACARAFPGLRSEFERVLARLDSAPVRVAVTHPLTGQPDSGTLTRGVFVERLRLILYSPNASASLPLLIHVAHEGDWSPFADLAAQFGFAIFNQVSMGMQLSVVCAEDVPLLASRDIDQATAGTFAGDYRVRQQIEACAGWPTRPLPADYAEPVRSTVPVLILSGANDPATAPQWGTETAEHLTNSRHIVVPNAGHAPSNDCVSRVVAEFFARGSAAEVDASCVAEYRRPPFRLPEG